MARKTKEEAEKTRIQILETALEVFYAQGYSGSTLVDIAKKIGMTKGAIYWHFKSKVDLFLGLSAHMEDKLEASLTDLYTMPGGTDDIIRLPVRIVRMIAEDQQLNKYYNLVYYRMEWQDELLPVKDFFIQQEMEFRRYGESLFQMAQDKREIRTDHPIASMAAGWLALIDGFLSKVLLEEKKEKTTSLLEDLEFSLKVYLSGLQ